MYQIVLDDIVLTALYKCYEEILSSVLKKCHTINGVIAYTQRYVGCSKSCTLSPLMGQ